MKFQKKFQKILRNSKSFYEIPKIISKKLNYKCIPEIPKVWNAIDMKFLKCKIPKNYYEIPKTIMKFLKCKIPKNYYEIPKTIMKFQKDYEIPNYLKISKIIMKFK